MACIDTIETGIWDDEDIVRKWLVQLDDLIVPESLEIIKLSLHSELKQVQLESIKSSADLCNALKEVYDDEQKILSRIMCALKILGHRRYGHYSLRKLQKTITLQQTEFDSSCLPEYVDRAEFCLYQCLAMVCVVLPQEINERFIKHFAKQLEINPSTVKTPCEVLIKMIQADRISCANHEALIEEAMIKSHLSDEKIKKYKNRFEEIFSCGQTSLKNIEYGSQSSSRTTMDTTVSDTTIDDIESETTQLIPLTDSGDESDNDQVSESTTHSRLVKSRSTANLRNRRHHQRTNMLPTNTSILHRQSMVQNFFMRYRWKILCTFLLIILLFSCVVTFLTLGFAFMFGTDYANTTTLYWSNTTAIVANSSRAFSLQVVQDASFPGDNANEIDLYRVKSKCSELETSTDNYIEVGSDLTFINVTTTYAWMGSSITFHICGSTNQSIPFQRRLDAVIVKGLDDLQFTETFLYNFYKGLYFFPGVDGEWMCTNEMVQINDPDYYTIIFLPQSTADSFNYSVTYNIQSVDLAQLQDSITATLHKDQDKWDVPGPPLFETDICVIGTLKNRYTYDTLAKSRVHIRTHYASDATPRLGAIFLIIASLLGLLGTTLIISVVVLYKCCWKKSVSFK